MILKKAEAISEGAKLKGCSAYKFVLNRRDSIDEITEKQQLNLFIISINKSRKYIERIYQIILIIQKHHSNPNISPIQAWDRTPERIKEVLIDLRFRGDDSKRTRKYVQKLAYDGDVKGFGKVISDRQTWFTVPNDRFKRRGDFYKNN